MERKFYDHRKGDPRTGARRPGGTRPGGARVAGRPGQTRKHRRAGVEGIPAGFSCSNCGAAVPARAYGTRERNHCPHCLHSLHVDIAVGDRRSLCRGTMEPISLWKRSDGELAIIHRCKRCGTLKSNRVAGDDSDSRLIALARRVAAVIDRHDRNFDGKRNRDQIYSEEGPWRSP